MGKIFDRFGSLHLENEARVSQNFLIPLLTRFLGYQLTEIVPEQNFGTVEFKINRSKAISTNQLLARPDYVVTINGRERVCVCDSKGPGESLDDHSEQILAYCIAVRVNFLLITNGQMLRLYNANEIIFESVSMSQLDLQFEQLDILIGRHSAIQSTVLDRLRKFSPEKAGLETTTAAASRHVALVLSDYAQYLQRIVDEVRPSVALPSVLRQAFGAQLKTLPSDALHEFCAAEETTGSARYSLRTVIQAGAPSRLALVGESGIGKSSLMRQLLLEQARRALAGETEVLPVLVELGRYVEGGLDSLLQKAFARFGVVQSTEALQKLLVTGRLLLLLDGYDESLDKTTSSLDRELCSLMDTARDCLVIITTRPLRKPQFGSFIEYKFQPLSSVNIERFLVLQLGPSRAMALIEELKRKHLLREASNTLLLSLLVLIYFPSKKLPSSRRQILDEIISKVRKWEKGKPRRTESSLSWSVIENLLQKLAYRAFVSSDGYIIDRAIAEEVISESLILLKNNSRISSTVTVTGTLGDIEATGFLSVEEGQLVFWHRAFMEYFAATEVARLLDAGDLNPATITHDTRWAVVLPLALSQSQNATRLIRSVGQVNVFCAARALAEIELPEQPLLEEVVQSLSRRCRASSVYSLRMYSADLLCHLRGDVVSRELFRLLKEAPVGVQMKFLLEVVNRDLPEARKILEGRADWSPDTSVILDGAPKAAVLEALGQIGDADCQRAIIQQWKQCPNMFVGYSASNALITAIDRGTLTEESRDTLADWMISGDESSEIAQLDIDRVLLRLNDPLIAARLVDCLAHSCKISMVALRAEKILASMEHLEVAKLLLSRAEEEASQSQLKARSSFSEILKYSRVTLSLEDYKLLFEKAVNYQFKANVLICLGRFAYQDFESILHKALQAPSEEDFLRSNGEYAFLQGAAFNVLGQHKKLELILEERFYPTLMSDFGLEALANNIMKQPLSSFSAMLIKYAKKTQLYPLRVRLAYALAALGEFKVCGDMLDRLLAEHGEDGQVLYNIANGALILPEEMVLKYIRIVWSNIHRDKGSSGHLRHTCIEILERMNSEAARKELSKIVDIVLGEKSDWDLERALRGFAKIASPTWEDWLIQLLKRDPKISFHAQRRVIEALGAAGTLKSIAILERLFDTVHEEFRDLCFHSLRAIYLRAGQLWYHGEESQQDSPSDDQTDTGRMSKA